MDTEDDIISLAKQDNEQRVGNATAALDAYDRHLNGGDHRDDPAMHVADLIADLMHYCDKHGVDIEAVLATARMNHDAEFADAVRVHAWEVTA